jgi:hypothetical protein
MGPSSQAIDPGESARVTFELPVDALGFTGATWSTASNRATSS